MSEGRGAKARQLIRSLKERFHISHVLLFLLISLYWLAIMPPRISREEWYANQPRGAKPKWPTTSKAAGYAYPAWVNQKTKATKLIPVLSSDTSKLDKTRKVITLPDLAHLSFATAWAINMDPYNPIQPTYRDLLVKGPDGIYRVECQMFE